MTRSRKFRPFAEHTINDPRAEWLGRRALPHPEMLPDKLRPCVVTNQTDGMEQVTDGFRSDLDYHGCDLDWVEM